MIEPPPGHISANDAADMLNMSRNYVCKLITKGYIRNTKKKRNRWFVLVDEVRKFADEFKRNQNKIPTRRKPKQPTAYVLSAQERINHEREMKDRRDYAHTQMMLAQILKDKKGGPK